jgi:hypothetical protein
MGLLNIANYLRNKAKERQNLKDSQDEEEQVECISQVLNRITQKAKCIEKRLFDLQ